MRVFKNDDSYRKHVKNCKATAPHANYKAPGSAGGAGGMGGAVPMRGATFSKDSAQHDPMNYSEFARWGAGSEKSRQEQQSAALLDPLRKHGVGGTHGRGVSVTRETGKYQMQSSSSSSSSSSSNAVAAALQPTNFDMGANVVPLIEPPPIRAKSRERDSKKPALDMGAVRRSGERPKSANSTSGSR